MLFLQIVSRMGHSRIGRGISKINKESLLRFINYTNLSIAADTSSLKVLKKSKNYAEVREGPAGSLENDWAEREGRVSTMNRNHRILTSR